jgi:hypothetical protein
MTQVNFISSAKKKLPPADILYIAAHNDPVGLKVVQKKMKKGVGVSPQRILYTVYLGEMKNPSLIRLQENNTLFTIIAMEGEKGMMTSYNADIKPLYIKNSKIAIEAAQRMGFKELMFADEGIKTAAKGMPNYKQNTHWGVIEFGGKK